MDELFEELAGIIENEISVQHKTLEKLEEQQQILVKYSMDHLEDNLKDLDALHPEVKALDKARCAVKGRLADALKDAEAPFKERLAALEDERDGGIERTASAEGRQRGHHLAVELDAHALDEFLRFMGTFHELLLSSLVWIH